MDRTRDKEVVILMGSPRKKGNTELVCSAVTDGIEAAGAGVTLIRLSEQSIKPCLGCGGCERDGRCVIKDDMQQLYPLLDHAYAVIIASPIYFYGVTAQTKLFIDRTQALWSRKYVLGRKRDENQGHSCHGYFISVAATRGKQVFDGAELTVRYCFDAMDIPYGGKLVFPGIDQRGALANSPEKLEQARIFGCQVIQDQ